MICKECNQEKRSGGQGLCDACYHRLQRRLNPEKYQKRDKARWFKRRDDQNAKRKLRYQNNKEHHAEICHRNYILHIEERKRKDAEYRAKHTEEIRARNLLYSQTKRDHAKELQRLNNWIKKQPIEKLRANWVIASARRRARKKQLPHTLTRQEWEYIKSKFGNRCFYCGEHFDHLTQDHVIPLSRGGAYVKENIVPACLSCNSKKGDMTTDEFIAKIRKEQK